MANQNFRVGISIDLTQARSQLRRLEREFKSINIDFKDLGKANRDLDNVRRAIERLDRSFKDLDFIRIKQGFNTVANGVRELRSALFPADRGVDEMSRSLDRLARNAHEAERAIHGLSRAQRAQVSAGRVGAGGRQAARSGGSPIGFVGVGGALGFLGLGGVGARFAIGAGVIASVTALAFAMAEAARRTAEFVASTAQLSAEFDFLIRRANVLAGGDALGLFSDAALEQGKRTIFTANEAAQALGELARAGFDTEEAVAALPGVLDLAATDSLELADATLIVARTLRAFRLDASAATVVADVLAETAASTATSTTELAQGLKFVAPVAAQLQFPIQEIAAALGTLGDNGIVAGIAGRNLRFALTSLLAPTDTAREAMDKLGLRTTTLDGDFVSFRNIIQQLAEAQRDLGSASEFAGLVVDAFGVRASGALITLVQNIDSFENAVTENFQSFGRAAEIAEEQLGGLEGAFERLRGETEAQRIEGFRLSGLQAELAQFARELDSSMSLIFGAIVDPIFREIAEGSSLIRNEVLPGILAELPGIGDKLSGIIESGFGFIVENADTITAVIEGVTTAVAGLVDTFIGIGTILQPAIDLIVGTFNSLPDQLSSALVGAGAGAGVGGLVGALIGAVTGGLSGGAVAGPHGALIGAAIGGVTALIGSFIESSPIPAQAAEYGVDIGIAISEGLADGLDIGQAVDAAIASAQEPGSLQADTFNEVISNANVAAERVRFLESVLDEVNFGLFGTDVERVTEAFGLQSMNLTELNDEYQRARQELAGADAALQQILGTSEAQAEVLGAIASAEEILNGIRAREPQRAASFFVIRDPAEILRNVFAGSPLPALGRRIEKDTSGLVATINNSGDEIFEGFNDGMVVGIRQGQRILEQHVAELTKGVTDNFRGLNGALLEAQTNLLASLEGLQETLAGFSEGIGDSFRILALPDMQETFGAISGFDFAEILEPIFSPEEIDPEEFVEPTARSTLNGLFDAVEEVADSIGPKRADSLRNKLSAIFEDDGLTLGEQAVAGAFLVDQAFAEAQVQAMIDQVDTVLDRVEELGEQMVPEPIAPFRLPDEDRQAVEALFAGAAERNAELVRQQQVLTDLVASGDLILANAAAVSDTVLGNLERQFGRVDELRGQVEELQTRTDVQIGIITSDEDFLNAQADIAALEDEIAALGPAMTEGLEADLGGIPEAMVSPVEEGLVDIREALGIKSPSTVFQVLGFNMVEGLRIGWSASFPFFSSLVISNFANLIETIEAMWRNVRLVTPAPTSSGGGNPLQPGNALHSGGFVTGSGEQVRTLLGGEFVLRRGAVERLTRLGIDPTLLNRDPAVILHQPVTNNTKDTSRGAVTLNQNFDIHTTATQVNERRLMREAEKRMVRHAKGSF